MRPTPEGPGVIHFRCPGCLTTHTANRDFAGLRAKCIRCGMTMVIPGRKAAGVGPSDDDPGGVEYGATDPAADGELTRDEVEPGPPHIPDPETPPAEQEDEEPAGDPGPNGRKPFWIAVAVAAVAAVGVAGWMLSRPAGPPATPAAPVTAPSSAEPVAPLAPAPPSEVPGPAAPEAPPAPPAVAPTPREVAPRPEVRMTAARLRLDLAEDRAGTNQRLSGKVVEVRGTVGQSGPARLTLGDGSEDQPGATCTPAKGAEFPPLRPGQPVTVQGTYASDGKLAGSAVTGTAAPGDEAYLGKAVEVVGVISSNGSGEGGAPQSLTLEPHAADTPVEVRCLFRPTDAAPLAGLRVGLQVTVRGTCSGRAGRLVRVENCALVPDGGDPQLSAGFLRVAAGRLAAAYEADLLAIDRQAATAEPVPATPDELAAAFAADPRAANQTYRGRRLVVTGRVLDRRPQTHSVVFEVGTDRQAQVVAFFTPSRFRAVPDETTIAVRCVCSGLQAGRLVRLDAAECGDPGADHALHTTADFLPFTPGRELVYDQLTPGKGKDGQVQRFAVRAAAPDEFRVAPLKLGTLPGPSLFADPPPTPRWARDLSKSRVTVHLTHYRVRGEMVEVGTPRATGPARTTPPRPEPNVSWDPVLKLGLLSGESWTATVDGKSVTRTVTRFGVDAEARPTVEVRQVIREPNGPAAAEETTVVYARGVGMVRRVVEMRTPAGPATVVGETRLVEVRDGVNGP